VDLLNGWFVAHCHTDDLNTSVIDTFFHLPVIRMSDCAPRYRTSGIEEFLKERERAASLRRECR
jgi:hypothetical protein